MKFGLVALVAVLVGSLAGCAADPGTNASGATTPGASTSRPACVMRTGSHICEKG